MKSVDKLRELGKHTEPCIWTADDVKSAVMIEKETFDKCLDGIEREVAGMVPLPLDADGVPIHVGDVMAAKLAHGGSGRWVVDRMELTRAYDQDLWQIALDKDGACWVTPSTVRHHHAPTVEDVLREYALKCEEAGNSGPEVKRLATEYAARLMLAGEE